VDLGLAVFEVTDIAGLLDETDEPDEALPWLLGDLVEGFQLLVVGEYLLLVEPPSAEADAHFRHARGYARRR